MPGGRGNKHRCSEMSLGSSGFVRALSSVSVGLRELLLLSAASGGSAWHAGSHTSSMGIPSPLSISINTGRETPEDKVTQRP